MDVQKIIKRISKSISYLFRKFVHVFKFILIALIFYMILNNENNYNNIKKIGSISMLGMSLAVFPILAFITEFLINKSEDYFNKENYYLGYNLKKFELYNDKIIKSFEQIQINKLILTSFITSCLIIFLKLEFECLISIKANFFIKSIEKLLYSIWLTCIASYLFYIVIILYVILNFSKDEFYKGYFYDSLNRDIRIKIEKLISKKYEEKLNTLIIKSNNLEKDAKDFTRELFKRASLVANNNEELENFIHCCYHHEFEVINNLVNEYKNIDEYLSNISTYYMSKWQQISNSIYILSNVPDVTLDIATCDYGIMDYIENKYNDDEKFKGLFYGRYLFDFYGEEHITKNFIKSRIINVIGICFTDKKFINNIRFLGSFTQVFTMIGNKKNKNKFNDEEKIFFEYLLYMSYNSILFNNPTNLTFLKELDYIAKLFYYDKCKESICKMKNKFKAFDFDYSLEIIDFLKENK